MSNLPPDAQRFFWDVDASHLDADEHSRYVIERLLELGDLPAVRWMLEHFPRQDIINVLVTSRRLSCLSANFWALHFGVDKETVPCLLTPSRPEQDRIWPY